MLALEIGNGQIKKFQKYYLIKLRVTIQLKITKKISDVFLQQRIIGMNNNRRRNFRSRPQKNNFVEEADPMNSNPSNGLNNNGNTNFNRNGSMNNI